MSLTKTVALSVIGSLLAGVLALLGLIAVEIVLFIITLISQSHGISAQDKALMEHVGHSVMGMKRSDAYAFLQMNNLRARNALSYRHGLVDVHGPSWIDWPPQRMKTRNGVTWRIDEVEVNYGSTASCHASEVQIISFGPDDRVDKVTHHPDSVCM